MKSRPVGSTATGQAQSEYCCFTCSLWPNTIKSGPFGWQATEADTSWNSCYYSKQNCFDAKLIYLFKPGGRILASQKHRIFSLWSWISSSIPAECKKSDLVPTLFLFLLLDTHTEFYFDCVLEKAQSFNKYFNFITYVKYPNQQYKLCRQ